MLDIGLKLSRYRLSRHIFPGQASRTLAIRERILSPFPSITLGRPKRSVHRPESLSVSTRRGGVVPRCNHLIFDSCQY
jgi:hypothetical protein